jgi:hypothetical protein
MAHYCRSNSFGGKWLRPFRTGIVRRQKWREITMTSLLLIGVLIGGLLGLRFTVYALVPAIGLALGYVAVEGISGGGTVWHVVAAMAVITIALQLGWSVGCAVRFMARTRHANDIEAATHDRSPEQPRQAQA